ncbi:tRNA 4-thiouridine(8) synthase ThiI [Fodinisporobacter ferrooxydans]|uniref:Probable tRNA sulfurtransferase n=1 Tax=Fodinisporobacter ferrooxydans TaxID=2901836 RepID=A0ABY4CTY2_9BACL|nr:tRNA 4-thiouridine(8) synthase ThiI [Alicyclobacillaceae bacterium MYW30-H2]
MIVRYGEIGTKGKNRSFFEKTLVENIRRMLHQLPGTKVSRTSGRILVHVEQAERTEEAIRLLQDVYGIVSISPVAVAALDIEEIKRTALNELQEARKHKQVRTFRVSTSRSNKNFPQTSMEISRNIGGYLLHVSDGELQVDLHAPDCIVSIEIREQDAYVYTQEFAGQGGLPVGTAGKGLLLLSGGIDSPVAGVMGMRRGLTLEAIHYHSYPFTSERALQKVQTLAQILSYYGGSIRLHVVPFTEIQKQIRQHCHEELSVTIMRRFMFRIAAAIAEKRKIKALLTGESLGQVASQTIESMHTINAVTNMPVLRPLIASDKTDVIRVARQIGTYETSILPYEDCCTIFLPKHPATKPKREDAEKEEQKLEVAALVLDAVEKTEAFFYRADELAFDIHSARKR